MRDSIHELPATGIGEEYLMESKKSNSVRAAVERNRARKLIGPWTKALSDACNADVRSSAFLSIEETGRLRNAFFEMVKNSSEPMKRNWPRYDIGDLIAHTSKLREIAGQLTVVVFSDVDRLIGAVRLRAAAVLSHLFAVWNVVHEDLAITTADLNNGLCLELNFYTLSGQYVKEGVFEMTAWGAFASGGA